MKEKLYLLTEEELQSIQRQYLSYGRNGIIVDTKQPEPIQVPDDEEMRAFSKEYSESFPPRDQLTVESSHLNGSLRMRALILKRNT